MTVESDVGPVLYMKYLYPQQEDNQTGRLNVPSPFKSITSLVQFILSISDLQTASVTVFSLQRFVEYVECSRTSVKVVV